jgi:hypothetical protein
LLRYLNNVQVADTYPAYLSTYCMFARSMATL